MAATGAAVAVNTNEQYNYDIVRKFTIMTLIWGAIGMFVGVYIASELAFPVLNFDNPYITFGRLRPVHTGAVMVI
ncbi:MAG: cytochrome C oxidase Cbb3, partial [Nitrosomonadales bacterium]|nr:cytochrome C oxidase Cbb3 [Nitrosomonadales bacterium]